MADGLARSAAEGDSGYRDWIGGIHDSGIGAALVEHADRVLERDPRRAFELYGGALECGLNPAAHRRTPGAGRLGIGQCRPRRVRSSTDVPLLQGVADGDRVADTSAAIWSMRGMMRMSDAVYRSLPPAGADSRARATIAALGAGQPRRPAESRRRGARAAVDSRRRDGPARPRPARLADAGRRRVGGRRPRPRVRDVHVVRDLGAHSGAARSHRRDRGDERRRPRHRAHRHRRRDPRAARAATGRAPGCCSGGRGSPSSARGPPRRARL